MSDIHTKVEFSAPKVADTVVIRHKCHCETAVELPEGGDPEEHRFDVDGEKFPWFISERGPLVDRLADDLWRVNVEILQIDAITRDLVTVAMTGYTPYGEIPAIDTRSFPWMMDDQGWTLQAGHKMLATVTLGFLARDVDTNMPYNDLRPDLDGRAIYCSGGDLIRAGAESCKWCDELIDDHFSGMLKHHQDKHPERIVWRDGQPGIETVS